MLKCTKRVCLCVCLYPRSCICVCRCVVSGRSLVPGCVCEFVGESDGSSNGGEHHRNRNSGSSGQPLPPPSTAERRHERPRWREPQAELQHRQDGARRFSRRDGSGRASLHAGPAASRAHVSSVACGFFRKPDFPFFLSPFTKKWRVSRVCGRECCFFFVLFLN